MCSPPSCCFSILACKMRLASFLPIRSSLCTRMVIVTTTHSSRMIPVPPSSSMCGRILFRIEENRRTGLSPPARYSCGSPRSTLNGAKLHEDRSYRICSSRAHATQDRHTAWSSCLQYPHCSSHKLYLAATCRDPCCFFRAP